MPLLDLREMSANTLRNDFRKRYLDNLVRRSFSFQRDNWAEYRYGPNNQGTVNIESLRCFIEFVCDNTDGLAETEELLSDQESRNIFHELLSYRSLGHLHVRMRRNTPAYRQFVESVETNPHGVEVLVPRVAPVRHKFMHIYRIPHLDVSVMATNGFLINVLFTRQYQYERDGVRILPEEGDVILDCGACWGDTSVMFASMAGTHGHVHAFEFVPENIQVFNNNINLNPNLEKNITLVKHPVSGCSGEELRFDSQGPGTRPGKTGSQTANTISIDDYDAKAELEKVDFLKMDIEGGEAEALNGARNTIQRFRPRLAISIYHRPEDLIQMPRLIKQLHSGYDLYLDHHTIHSEETVLYAKSL